MYVDPKDSSICYLKHIEQKSPSYSLNQVFSTTPSKSAFTWNTQTLKNVKRPIYPLSTFQIVSTHPKFMSWPYSIHAQLYLWFFLTNNFNIPFTCKMLLVVSIIVWLSHSMNPFCSWTKGMLYSCLILVFSRNLLNVASTYYLHFFDRKVFTLCLPSFWISCKRV